MNPPQKTSRLDWIDNLRTAMILLVVNMHACVTYSHVGDWYFMEKAEPATPIKILFLFWQGHLQSFFMGLLFFLAGYFAFGSLHKKGSGPFLRERFQRLGIPALLYMLVIHPCTVYFLLGRTWGANKPTFAGYYSNYIFSGKVLGGSGPLWFALALLIFSIVYALLPSRRIDPKEPVGRPPALRSLLLMCVALIFTTFLIRLVQPIGTNIFNLQLCFFAQYIVAFVAGIAAAKGRWLQALAESVVAQRALWIGLIGGPIALATVLLLGGDPGNQQPPAYAGGWNWQAFGLAAWEQSAGPCLALGLMSLFQKHLSFTNPLLKWLSDRSFAVYVLHAPVLIALAMAMKDIPLNAPVKTLTLTVTGLIGTYLLGDLAKRLPGLKQCL